MFRSKSIISLIAVASALVLAAPQTASAAEVSDPIATGLAGPLQIDVSTNGSVYVAQNFAGVLTKIRPNGTTKDLHAEPASEIAGVASRGYDVAFLTTGADPAHPSAYLKVRKANGKVRIVANLWKYERLHNPDARNVYGFRHLTDECAAEVPPEIGGEPYTGILESHPYGLVNAPDGGWYVADAAANTIYYVSKKGHIEVVNVPRPQKTTVTEDAAAAVGLPDCTIGATYAFEPVPTDVEMNKLGYLIVSLLPGGPEDPSLGARGAVYRIAPGDGEWTRLADGFLGATNVAIGPKNQIYVSELFGNKISVINKGVVSDFADVPSPAGLEYANGKLYAATDVFGAGSIVTITP